MKKSIILTDSPELAAAVKAAALGACQHVEGACSDIASGMIGEKLGKRTITQHMVNSGAAADLVYNDSSFMQDLLSDKLYDDASAIIHKLGLHKDHQDAIYNFILDAIIPLMRHVDLEPLRQADKETK